VERERVVFCKKEELKNVGETESGVALQLLQEEHNCPKRRSAWESISQGGTRGVMHSLIKNDCLQNAPASARLQQKKGEGKKKKISWRRGGGSMS